MGPIAALPRRLGAAPFATVDSWPPARRDAAAFGDVEEGRFSAQTLWRVRWQGPGRRLVSGCFSGGSLGSVPETAGVVELRGEVNWVEVSGAEVNADTLEIHRGRFKRQAGKAP